jgi:hypothetical protein
MLDAESGAAPLASIWGQRFRAQGVCLKFLALVKGDCYQLPDWLIRSPEGLSAVLSQCC